MSFFLHLMLYIGTMIYFFGSGIDFLKDTEFTGIERGQKYLIVLIGSIFWPALSIYVLVLITKLIIEKLLDKWFPDGK